jgi:hypothetical protein
MQRYYAQKEHFLNTMGEFALGSTLHSHSALMRPTQNLRQAKFFKESCEGCRDYTMGAKKKKANIFKRAAKGAVKGTKAVGKGAVKGTKAVGRGVVKGGKAIKKGAKFLAKGAKALAKKVIALFNKLVIKNIAKLVGKKKGMNGFSGEFDMGYSYYLGNDAFTKFCLGEKYASTMGIDSKQTAKDTAGYSAEFLKEKQGDIATKVLTASVAAAAGGPTAPALAMSAMAPYGVMLAKEGAVYVAQKLLTGKPSTTDPASLDAAADAAVSGAASSGDMFGDVAAWFSKIDKKTLMIAGGGAAGLILLLLIIKNRGEDEEYVAPRPQYQAQAQTAGGRVGSNGSKTIQIRM